MSTSPTAELCSIDAVEYLRRIPTGSVDLVITDPPYESLEKHRAKGTTTRIGRDWAAARRGAASSVAAPSRILRRIMAVLPNGGEHSAVPRERSSAAVCPGVELP